ncbi:hsp70 nucleotide exchange factor fes1 [Pseudogymnoascus australis]
MNPELNKILKWSVENSAAPVANGAVATDATPRAPSTLDPQVLASLFGGPSEADLMKDSMSAILSTDPEMTMEARMIAFDNFEQLIENLDNANLMEPLKLWQPLISLLSSDESDLRMMAAWCIGTAVQNNEKSQKMLDKETKEVRRKAIYALSSALRNCQEAMNEFVDDMKDKGQKNFGIVDAGDMDAVDGIINGMREAASKSA